MLKKTLKKIREELCTDGFNVYKPDDLTTKEEDGGEEGTPKKLEGVELETIAKMTNELATGHLDGFFPEGTFVKDEEVEMELKKTRELTGKSADVVIVDDIAAASLDKFRKSYSTPYSKRMNKKYEITDGGKDVMFNFGRYKGVKASKISLADKSYLLWMIRSKDFPKDLIEVVKKFV